MASSALALFNGGNGDFSYNGYDFSFNGGSYIGDIDGNLLTFDYLPGDVEDIPLEAYPIVVDKVYIVDETNSSDVVGKLESVFVSQGVLPVNEERDCAAGDMVIKVVEGGESKIYIDNACIVLEGNPYKTSDRFAYWYLGVI